MYTAYVLIFSIAIFSYIKWRRSRANLYRFADKLDGPPGLPLIGNALEFSGPPKDILNKIVSIHATYRSSPIRLWLGPRLLVAFVQVDQIEKILLSSKLAYKDTIYDPIKVMVGEGLITGSGSRTRQHRKMMAPILSPRNLNGYIDIFEKYTQAFMEKLKDKADGTEFDIYNTMSRLCSHIVFDSIMDHQISEEENDRILSKMEFLYDTVFERLVKIWMKFDITFRCSRNASKYFRGVKEYISYFRKLLETKRAEFESKEQSRSDKSPSTLEQLLKSVHAEPDIYTEQEIVDELLTLFAAAQDTATSICSFVFIMLGAYPEVQERVYQETKEIRCNLGNPLSPTDVSNLRYTEMVIKEVLRLFPIAPFLVRQCYEDVKIDDNITIPSNCSVVLGIYDLHHQPEHWEHPWQFYPEHFLPEAVANRHPSAYLPFSQGVRSCLGKYYAMTLMKVIVTGVVQRYKIVADKKVKDLHLHNDISVRSTYGYKLKLFLRT